MNVLIAFVTTNDPWPKNKKAEGPAQTVTAVVAKKPGVIHLLYTDSTVSNLQQTRDVLTGQLRVPPESIRDHKLDLSDITDYHRMKELIPPLLKSIKKGHIGVQYYLLSGLPQPRLIFALCLVSQVLDGTLLEVSRPDPQDPWPKTSEGYSGRVEELDLRFFQHFRQMYEEKYKDIRLRLDLKSEQAWVDGWQLNLRATSARRSREGISRARTFQILVLLAAKKLYGAGDDVIAKSLISRTVYTGQLLANAQVNIRRALHSINRQALLARTYGQILKSPIDPLILDVPGRAKGNYRLTEKLHPPYESIGIIGELRPYLRGMNLSARDIASIFPHFEV